MGKIMYKVMALDIGTKRIGVALSDYLLMLSNGHSCVQRQPEEQAIAKILQIAKDNKKNMDLKLSGHDVIRFSGSQIFSDPYSCALDAYKFIKSKLNGGGIDEGC